MYRSKTDTRRDCLVGATLTQETNMSTTDPLILLIEKAGAIAGSEYKLAKAMGIPQQTLSGWKAGRRPCTPPDRARLAGFAREDAVQELVRATLAQTAGTLRGEQLMRVLGKQSRVTGAALHTVLLSMASLIYGTAILDIPRCILGKTSARYRLC